MQLQESLEEAYVDLAKFALQLEQIVLDEITHKGSRFARDYTIIQEQGLYWILCELHKLAVDLNSELRQEVFEEVSGTTVTEVNSGADRQIRDYAFLESLNDVLHRMIVKFKILARQTDNIHESTS